MKNIVSVKALFIALLFLFFSCSQKEESSVLLPELANAEAIMYQHPDSALKILEQMAVPPASDRLQNATWCLLMTQAIYKNFIDIPSDSLIDVAHKYFMEQDDPHRKATVLYLKGALNKERNNVEEALKNYLEASKYLDQIKDYQLGYFIYYGIGDIYVNREFENYVMEACLEANRYAILSKNKFYISGSFQLIGRVYWLQKNREESYKYFKKAEEAARETGNIDVLSAVLSDMSMVYFQAEEWDTALEYAKKALELRLSENLKAEATLSIIGKLYYKKGQIDSAYYCLEKAKLSSNIYNACAAYKNLYQISKEERDYVRALEYNDKYQLCIDSILSIDRGNALIEMQERYNQEKEINEKNQLKMKNDQITRNALLGGIFLIVIIATIIYVYQRKVVKNSRTIQKNEEQIRMYTLKMHENEALIGRNENRIEGLISEIEQNQGIQEQLEELQKAKTLIEQSNAKLRDENVAFQDSICNYSTTLQEKAKLLDSVKLLSDDNQRLCDREKFLCEQLTKKIEVLNNLKKAPNYLKVDQWEKIREAIDFLYNSFTYRLIKDFPSLTEVDLKICYLVKLHISVSDMSTILAIEPGSVSKNKQRLKEHIIKDLGKPFSENQTVDLWIWEY